MPENDLALTPHLMRRAGFGATRTELEALSAKGYEAIVDDLLHPERFPDVEEDILKRYYLELTYQDSLPAQTGQRMYRNWDDYVDVSHHRVALVAGQLQMHGRR